VGFAGTLIVCLKLAAGDKDLESRGEGQRPRRATPR
jgi:hypothetical protein